MLIAHVCNPRFSREFFKGAQLFASGRSGRPVQSSCPQSSCLLVVFRVCRSPTGWEAHPTETLPRCSPRTSANLVFPEICSKVRSCAIVDAASLPHRRGYWFPHAGRHSPRLGCPVQCLRPGHPRSSILHSPCSIFHLLFSRAPRILQSQSAAFEVLPNRIRKILSRFRFFFQILARTTTNDTKHTNEQIERFEMYVQGRPIYDWPGEGDRIRPPSAGPHQHQHDPAVHAPR